jgi:Family of unknown function (DUF695)
MRKKRQPERLEDVWFGAEGEENGKPLIFRGRQYIPSGAVEPGYPTRVSIYWPYEPENESGLPDEETTDAQHDLENALDKLDSSEFGYLMFVVLGNGRKEWHWYVSEAEAWGSELNKLLADYPVFPIRIEKSDEPDWALFRDFISGFDGI